MNRKWIYCMTLICQQQIENSIVYKKWWKKTISENLVSTNILVKKLFNTKNYFCVYIYKTFSLKFLFKASEHILSKWSYLFEPTSVFTSTMQDVQKKNDTKFKTLKLLEKDTPRIFERKKESELIKQKQLYKKRLDETNNLKIEILVAMLENENTEEKIV